MMQQLQKQKFYYCYILYSESLKMTYVGYTSNLNRRMLEHKENPTRTTARADDWKLVWYSAFTNQDKAEKFERHLKSGNGRIFVNKRLLGNLLKENDNIEEKLSSP